MGVPWDKSKGGHAMKLRLLVAAGVAALALAGAANAQTVGIGITNRITSNHAEWEVQ